MATVGLRMTWRGLCVLFAGTDRAARLARVNLCEPCGVFASTVVSMPACASTHDAKTVMTSAESARIVLRDGSDSCAGLMSNYDSH
jgi:hypothetical protein